MVDQSLVQSGFDIEVLLSARFVRYALLAQVEAGRLPLALDIEQDGIDVHLVLHPPSDYERRYEPATELPPPDDGSFVTELLVGDPEGANVQLSVVTDITDETSGEERLGVTVGLLLRLDLVAETDDRGFERNHQLSISLVRLDPLTQLALAFAGLPVDDVTAAIKAQLDRTVPFGVASGQAVQRALLAVLPGGDGRPAALGVYLDLLLKDGPEPDAFVGERGDVADAVNFLEDGRDLAFATSSGLFGLLGTDTFHRMAEEDPPGSGSFRHPLRENPNDRTSDEIGRLHSVTIGPQLDLSGQPTGALRIVVAGEYQVDVLPDPGFRLILTLRPVLDGGVLSWDVDADVDVDLLGSLLGILTVVVGTLILGPGAGVTLFLLILAADLIVDAVASAVAAGRADELADASFLDALPARLTCADRRWDPLYSTHHQVVSLLERFDITPAGMAFDGVAVLDREPAPIAHAVIRDEERDPAGDVVALRYRVRDLGAIGPDLAAVGPGTDRRPYTPVTDPERGEPLVALDLGQVAGRMDEGRLVGPILYLPERIHLVDNTIDQLLVISEREVREQRDALTSAFRRAAETRVRTDEGDEIAADAADALRASLGRDPTPEELADAVDAEVGRRVGDALSAYAEGELPGDLDDAVAALLRFDLAPHELAALQDDGVLAIPGKEIIRMRSGTVYYRDRPDLITTDNLLALERYRAPYAPPAP